MLIGVVAVLFLRRPKASGTAEWHAANAELRGGRPRRTRRHAAAGDELSGSLVGIERIDRGVVVEGQRCPRRQ